MKNNDIQSQIDMALQNVEMPDGIRQLLIMLREEIPKAKTTEERRQIALKLVEIITTVVSATIAVIQQK
jgi:hypothetical protein